MVELKILGGMTGYARNRRFRYGPYIELFNDGAAVAGSNA